MLGPVVAGERLTNRLVGFLATAVTVLGKNVRIVYPLDDRADDAHPGEPGDVAYDVVQLDVHLHERLLHVLDVRRPVVDQAFAVTQVRT